MHGLGVVCCRWSCRITGGQCISDHALQNLQLQSSSRRPLPRQTDVSEEPSIVSRLRRWLRQVSMISTSNSIS